MPQATLELVHLRASQINGCSATNLFNRLNVITRQVAGAAWSLTPVSSAPRIVPPIS